MTRRNLFLLNDGSKHGSGFELASIPAEAASPEYLESVFDKIRDTFAAWFHYIVKTPGFTEMYVNDDYCLKPVLSHIDQ